MSSNIDIERFQTSHNLVAAITTQNTARLKAFIKPWYLYMFFVFKLANFGSELFASTKQNFFFHFHCYNRYQIGNKFFGTKYATQSNIIYFHLLCGIFSSLIALCAWFFSGMNDDKNDFPSQLFLPSPRLVNVTTFIIHSKLTSCQHTVNKRCAKVPKRIMSSTTQIYLLAVSRRAVPWHL